MTTPTPPAYRIENTLPYHDLKAALTPLTGREAAFAELLREAHARIAELEAENFRHLLDGNGCPCKLTTPCGPNCTCFNWLLSGGCDRCVRYGSYEQQKQAAERLAALPVRIAELEAEIRHLRALQVAREVGEE